MKGTRPSRWGASRGGTFALWGWIAALALLVAPLGVACGGDEPPSTRPACEGEGCEADASSDAEIQDSDVPRDGEVGSNNTQNNAENNTGGDDVGPDLPDTVEDVVEDEPTPIDAALGAQGEWGPAARMVSFDVPNNAREARSFGCLSQGANLGVGLGNIIILAGGIEQFIRPDAEGQIALLILAQALGWEEGQSIDEVGEVDLRFFDGVGGPEPGYQIARTSFADEDPAGEVLSQFPQASINTNGWLETSPGRFRLSIPAFEGLVLVLPIEYAVFSSRVRVDEPGMSLSGVLTGYLEGSTIEGLIDTVRASCQSESPPQICGLFGSQIERPNEELLPTILGFVQGYDARMEGGFPFPCDPADEEPESACNVISVCIQMNMEGVAIEGVVAD